MRYQSFKAKSVNARAAELRRVFATGGTMRLGPLSVMDLVAILSRSKAGEG